jgi:hypothetical protein
MAHFTEKEVLARMRSAQLRERAVLGQRAQKLTMKHVRSLAVFFKALIQIVISNHVAYPVLVA